MPNGTVWDRQVKFAASRDDWSTVMKLLHQEHNFTPHSLGETLLSAAEKRQLNVVETLLLRGADVNHVAPTPVEETPLFLASKNQDFGMMDLLLGEGATVRERDLETARS